MKAMQDLNPDGTPSRVAPGVTLETPGLTGRAELLAGGAASARGIRTATPEFEAAMRRTGLSEQLTIVIDDVAPAPPPPGTRTRSTARGEPAIVADVPGPSDGFEQLLLAVDEDGVATWCVPEPVSATSMQPTLRGADSRRYLVPLRFPQGQPTGNRGLISALGRKVLKVVAYKALEIVGGKLGAYFVDRWERAHRPHHLRPFTPDDYTSPSPRTLGGTDWQALAAGPALLFLHGTFSQAHAAFGRIPRADVERLHQQYDGRVFAFDHPTVGATPDANMEALLRSVPAGIGLEVDIVAHSRGGLLGRVLNERGVPDRLRVRNLVFVGTPNAGTPLADPDHIRSFIDTYTNLLSFFPENGVTEVLEVVITVLKQIAVGALEGLDGLQSMDPSGQWLRELNTPTDGPALYHAISADFEPSQPGLADFARDRLMDAVFDQVQNDLVVPTAGVWDANGSNAFPVASRLVLPGTDGVSHNTFFSQASVLQQLQAWLPG